ncbi:class I SAM-dependent methyltransferase [cf. Phormidesmis sp. LEGE 11477]|uniref:class I SAM-dependent methyltransferase n=1 Tax=cf. Phormidesmis sp. LEGE 11477 TaxID=1828680 RepID=UPI001880F5CD|nr:class I SAM-dependent methyltransferase [cf. Phormidesmis sp. LEGE 11477]MBE9059962.1 class I SAM-dependent methyltransferase [cf. Phormidesmis sp. LEGE 11477]
MSSQSIGLDARLYEYLLSASIKELPVQTELRKRTAEHPQSRMQISPEQGQFMALLVQLIGAKKTLEIGVFTGYSALCVALALPDDGQIVACDVNEKDCAIARTYWQKANIAHKIDLRLAPALDTLDHLIDSGESNTFDFAFIDADKSNYDSYYEKSLQLVRPGGLIAIDNMLWYGRVADPDMQDKRTQRIRALNGKVRDDERVTMSLLPVGDGLLLALRNRDE